MAEGRAVRGADVFDEQRRRPAHRPPGRDAYPTTANPVGTLVPGGVVAGVPSSAALPTAAASACHHEPVSHLAHGVYHRQSIGAWHHQDGSRRLHLDVRVARARRYCHGVPVHRYEEVRPQADAADLEHAALGLQRDAVDGWRCDGLRRPGPGQPSTADRIDPRRTKYRCRIGGSPSSARKPRGTNTDVHRIGQRAARGGPRRDAGQSDRPGRRVQGDSGGSCRRFARIRRDAKRVERADRLSHRIQAGCRWVHVVHPWMPITSASIPPRRVPDVCPRRRW